MAKGKIAMPKMSLSYMDKAIKQLEVRIKDAQKKLTAMKNARSKMSVQKRLTRM